MRVKALGYIGFEVSDIPAWERFSLEVLGLGLAGRGSDDSVSFRLDDWSQRITVHPGEKDDLSYLGFEVEDEKTLKDFALSLTANGYEISEGSAETCKARKVESLIHLTDPDGIDLELFVGPTHGARPFTSPLVSGGFYTGPGGVGHFALGTADQKKKVQFYVDVLGMKMSDQIVEEGIAVTFLRANQRHHTLGVANVALPKHVEHFMLQVTNAMDMGLAYQRCIDAGVVISRSIGQHPNDKMVSFYAVTPSGFSIEIGQGGLQVDDETWDVKKYDRLSSWGHKATA